MTRIRLATADGVARVTLARPEKKNALDRAAADELHDAFVALQRDAAVRVVLLDADGDDFCAGADLAALAGMLDQGPEAHREDALALGRVFTAIRALPQPVVAAVQGRALAGGAGLATACDIVLAAASARFGYPEVRVGFVPAMVMTTLRRLTGEKRAFELVATGRQVDAAEALAMGLVSRVLPDAGFAAAARDTASELARHPPAALRLTKRLFYALDTLGYDDGIRLGAETNVEARATAEFRDGVRRFLSRTAREP